MELLSSIETSLIETNERQRDRVLSSINSRTRINDSITWKHTREGHLFWAILDASYRLTGEYDYLCIIKFYIRYGSGVFGFVIRDIFYLYEDGNVTNGSLSDLALEHIFKKIDENGFIKIN